MASTFPRCNSRDGDGGAFLLREGTEMFNQAGRIADWQPNQTCIRLNEEHLNGCRAGVLLEALGGRRRLPEKGTIYRFLTGVRRNDALELVCRKFGPTVAEPYGRRPCMPGARPESEPFRGHLPVVAS
jgi:hypothetical protein